MKDTTIIEIQINDDGTIENSYRVNSEEGLPIFNWVIQRNPALTSYFESIELISFAPVDFLTVKKESAVIVINYAPEDGLMDYFALKVDDQGKITKKYYKPTHKVKRIIDLPQGSIVATQFGIGFYPEESYDLFDCYFFHDDLSLVETFFNRKLDSVEGYIEGLKLFGVTYNSQFEVVKLKRYLFPDDPQIEFPERL